MAVIMYTFLNCRVLKIAWQVLVPALLLVIAAGCEPGSARNEPEVQSEESPAYEEVIINGHVIMMELALTPEQRATGLMGRESMRDDEGMLFVFPDAEPYPAEVRFWMKDCLMPIDVVFLNREVEIVSIHEMEPPESGTPDEKLKVYPSGAPVQFAIELRGGLANELGLEIGEVVELRSDYLLEWAK